MRALGCMLLLGCLPTGADQYGLYRRRDVAVDMSGCKSIEAVGPLKRLAVHDEEFHIYVPHDNLREVRFICLWQ